MSLIAAQSTFLSPWKSKGFSMSEPGSVTIINNLEVPIDISIAGVNWNCCEYPNIGQRAGVVAPKQRSYPLPFQKKTGHGCDGIDGRFRLAFQLLPAGNYLYVDCSFNSDAFFYMTPPGGFNASLNSTVPRIWELTIWR